MRALLPLALVALPAAVLASGGDSGATAPRRDSLEQLLDRARKQRQQVQDKLRGNVQAIVQDLEHDPDPKEVPALVERVVGLGEEATPLLVPYLDPGEAATDKERLRAFQISTALSRMDTCAVTGELLRVLTSGPNEAKRNALRVLQASPEKERVRPAIVALFREGDSTLKQASLRTLLAIGGPEADRLLEEVLAGADENLIALAIEGLQGAQGEAALEQVRKILAQPAAGARHALSLLAYFASNPPLLKSQDVAAFVRIAQQAGVPLDTRVAVIDGLAPLDPPLDAELRKLMEPIVGAADRRLRESGLVMLARLGDKKAERDLRTEYDELIEKNQRWPEAYKRRGDMYARIGNDDEAIKDYKQALQVGRDDPTLQPDVYVSLARALVRKGKLKEAADRLRASPLSLKDLHALADDPEFAPLRNSKYGPEAFALEKPK